ncbi:MAG: hypothetical protein M9950_04080 [Thermomicrobiales bacterium]|nr:hypothetical protein [Thermomicrobiales bacterium]
MFRRVLTMLVSMIVLLVPLTANTVSAQATWLELDLSCGYGTSAGNGNAPPHYLDISVPNTWEDDLRIDVYVIEANAELQLVTTSPGIASGETWEAHIDPLPHQPTNGWRIEGWVGDFQVWGRDYTEGACSVSNGDWDVDPQPTPTQTPDPTPTPAPNSFNLVSAQRMCADQQFQATWSGANIVSLEFALSNTSDEWTSGWIPVDPAAGTVTHAVDHHGYDKAVFRVVFEDDASDMIDADVGDCAEVPAPPPPAPPTSSGGSSQEVTSLPSTGSGLAPETMVTFGVLVLAVSALAVAGVVRREQP